MYIHSGVSHYKIFEEIEKVAFQRWKSGKHRRIGAKKRIEDLEQALEAISLLANALAEACIRKGVLDQGELVAVIRELDLSDGVLDGKLSPKGRKKGSSKKSNDKKTKPEVPRYRSSR